jgi:hypothetical protein
MFEDLIFTLIGYALVFWAGVRWGRVSAALSFARNLVENPAKLRRMMQEIEQLAKEDTEETTTETLGREITVHKEGEQFYLYRKSNNQFLAQGDTLKDALDAVGQRFPNETFAGVISKDQAEQWGLSNKN